MKYAIFGDGGFGREVRSLITEINPNNVCTFITPENEAIYEPDIHGLPIIAIGTGSIRKKIVNILQNKFSNIEFPNIIHPSANLGINVNLGQGIIITHRCILTTDIQIGDFSILNLATTVGHDAVTGPYMTTAPGVHISGNVLIGTNVYFGTNSTIIEKISVCSDVIVGAGAVVTKNIYESGTYVGVPAKKLKGR